MGQGRQVCRWETCSDAELAHSIVWDVTWVVCLADESVGVWAAWWVARLVIVKELGMVFVMAVLRAGSRAGRWVAGKVSSMGGMVARMVASTAGLLVSLTDAVRVHTRAERRGISWDTRKALSTAVQSEHKTAH